MSYFPRVKVDQDVKTDVNNSSTINLASSASFTGTASSTLGISGIQVILKSDQICTVQVQQSSDATNWDIVDTYTVSSDSGDGRTIQAVASYFRVIVTNNGSSSTTYFRLQTSLCPIVEALPRSLTRDGRLKVEAVTGVPVANTPIQLAYEKTAAALIANQWQDVLSYTVPTNHDLSCVWIQGESAQASDSVRAVSLLKMGSLDTSTGVFSSGSSWNPPQFASKLYVYVTSLIGSVSNDTITITYVNQSGVSGRTATVSVPKNSVVGTRLEIQLQSGDYGVYSVTSVTHTTTQIGAIDIEGTIALMYLELTAANTMYDRIVPDNSITVRSGQTVRFQFRSSTASNKYRKISLIGNLISRI